jgi:hypothetical protein
MLRVLISWEDHLRRLGKSDANSFLLFPGPSEPHGRLCAPGEQPARRSGEPGTPGLVQRPGGPMCQSSNRVLLTLANGSVSDRGSEYGARSDGIAAITATCDHRRVAPSGMVRPRPGTAGSLCVGEAFLRAHSPSYDAIPSARRISVKRGAPALVQVAAPISTGASS